MSNAIRHYAKEFRGGAAALFEALCDRLMVASIPALACVNRIPTLHPQWAILGGGTLSLRTLAGIDYTAADCLDIQQGQKTWLHLLAQRYFSSECTFLFPSVYFAIKLSLRLAREVDRDHLVNPRLRSRRICSALGRAVFV